MQRDTGAMATGRWRGILMAAGMDSSFLSDKHGPCPLCGGGKDRWHWNNIKGRGTWFCNTCNEGGDGFDLLRRFKGWTFPEAAKFVEQQCGYVEAEAPKPELSAEKKRQALRELWQASAPMQPGDPVDVYLRSRGIEHDCPEALRFAPSCFYSDGLFLPAMVAVVSDVNGKPVQMHRTYLSGHDKADVEKQRKLMPGPLPEGAAVRLGPPAETMGIAEGIETALSAAALFECVVWAALNAGQLEKWTPPEGCREVIVFGDRDEKFRGQAAAYRLAHTLAARPGFESVTVRLPDVAGWDWNDVLRDKGAAA